MYQCITCGWGTAWGRIALQSLNKQTSETWFHNFYLASFLWLVRDIKIRETKGRFYLHILSSLFCDTLVIVMDALWHFFNIQVQSDASINHASREYTIKFPSVY
jgi:hypothetical protein